MSQRRAQSGYQRVKEQARARSAAIALAGQDIAPLPSRRDPRRRNFADDDFRFFCESYFPHLFDLAWSEDHLRVIGKIERVIRDFETLAVAMPRGSGKTTLCLVAVIWAIVSGRHKFVMLIPNTQERAEELVQNIKSHLLANKGLLADYPEVIYPICRLEGEARRCTGQRYYGVLTRIGWGIDEIVMPSIPGSRCSGAIIRVSGITGNIRGALHVRPDGTQVRPSLAILDDPQTDQSARSVIQTRERLSIVNGAISGLAGPGERTAIIIPCTVIQQGDLADQLLDRMVNPSWHGERTKMVYSFPSDTKRWAEYARILHDSLHNDGDGHEATDYYALHRAEMDAGAVLAWPARFNVNELSAVQHAMNLKFKDERAFFAEYQNEPLPDDQGGEDMLKADQIVSKVNNMPRGVVPIAATHLSMFIDVQAKLLFYTVVAWERSFSGYVLDYGSYPDQKRPFYTLRDARRTMAMAHKGAGLEGTIYAGLEALTEDYMRREWRREDGAMMKIERCLIDANWGESTDVVYQFCRQSKRAPLVLPSHGKYVGASSVPFAEYTRKKGELVGAHWRLPTVTGKRQVRHVLIDTNYWKSFVHARLAVAMGDPGCLSLFGGKSEEHRLLAEQLTSEYRVRTTARGRTVDEWKQKPDKPDNHWLDCLVGCAAGASMAGCSLFENKAAGKPRAKRQNVEYL